MLVRYCGPGLLGLGITALIAGFMSGMAGNVSAFSAVWTYDIYQPLIREEGARRALRCGGRWATILGVVISIGTAYLVMNAAGIMDYVQALFSFFISPLLGAGADGHVLEARHEGGRLLGTAARHAHLDRALGMGQSRSIGAALCRAFAGCQGHGREHVSRPVVGDCVAVVVNVMVSLFDQAQPAGGAEWAGLRRDQAAGGRAGSVLQERVVLDGASRSSSFWPSTSISGKEVAHAFVGTFQSGSSSAFCSPFTARLIFGYGVYELGSGIYRHRGQLAESAYARCGGALCCCGLFYS